MDFFFQKCCPPQITLENGVQFNGSVLDSRGNIYHLEIDTNGVSTEGTFTNGKKFKRIPWSTSLIIQCNPGFMSLNEFTSGFCIDSIPVDYKFQVKSRQRVGSKVTSLRRFSAVYDLFTTSGMFDGVHMILEITHEMLTIKFYANESKKETR